MVFHYPVNFYVQINALLICMHIYFDLLYAYINFPEVSQKIQFRKKKKSQVSVAVLMLNDNFIKNQIGIERYKKDITLNR